MTGHPKGAAGAWMLNGAIQILESGLVPGNRNADNVDKLLEQYEYVLYPSRSIQTDGIKPFLLHHLVSVKRCTAVVVHPDYLFAVLDRSTYEEYATKVSARNKKTYRYMHNAITRNTMFVAKDKAPYSDEWNNQFTWIHWLVLKKTRKSWYSVTKQFNRANLMLEKLLKTAKALSSLNKSSKESV